MADRNHTVLRAALIPPSPRRRDRPTCRISCAPCWRRCLRPRSGVRVAIDVDLEFVFKGNIVASINLSAMETDPGINPFCWEAQKSGACGASTSPVTATYSNGYTTLTFSGPTLPENMSNIPGQTSYHLGLDPSASNGSGPSLQLVKKYWTFSATKTPLPVVSMNGPPLDTGAIKYEVLFVNVTQSGVTGGDWFEVPYTGSTPPMSHRPITRALRKLFRIPASH
jgi:hypothetical protein